jgi:[acyl-carrier-protein] S-malonyltransferase
MALEDLSGRKVGLIFPGQGSQTVGMGMELAERSAIARDVFNEADDVLGFPLSALCFEGPADELEDTYNAQPALLTMSVAALRDLEDRAWASNTDFEPIVTAGHSLGQFTAMVAARVIDFADALRLVRERGRLMKEAGEQRPGGMAAVIGMDDDALAAVVEEAGSEGVIRIANANCPGQTVISGEIPALERASALAQERGARKVARLGVSIASHSPLMADAARQLNDLLATVELRDPEIPIVGNGSAAPITTAEQLRAEMSGHMESPVRWTDSVRTMIDMGVELFVELGPGNVLAGLNRRIDRGVPTIGIKDLQ